MRAPTSVLLALTALLAARPAHARADRAYADFHGWPQPAAGVSASGNPELVLTFDDGPDTETTPIVLEILRAHKLHAIFFQVGFHFKRGDVPGSISLTRRMVASGHVIANHTITHAHLCLSPPERIAGEIVGARELLEQAAGMPVLWFRVPYGARCPRLETELAELGLAHFHWDIDPQEWQGRGVKRTVADVTKQLARIKDGERAVLLMHDTKVETRFALPEILDWIDAENAKREAAGRRPITFVGGDQIARERMAPTLDWLKTALGDGRDAIRATLAATVP